MAGIAPTTGAPPTRRRQLNAASFAIHPSHVRTLLWLRSKLTLRRYTRGWQQILGLVISLILLIPTAIGLGVVTTIAYTSLTRPAATQLAFAIVVVLYMIWALLPLLQYSLNEGLDVTKLQIYPLTRGEQMVSLVLSTLLDIGSIFLLALYVAILIGWSLTPASAAFAAVALVVIYVHTVGFSQLILAALMGLLRSRRFRDLTIIVFAVLGSICSLSGQIFPRLLGAGDIGPSTANGAAPDPSAILASLHLDQYLRWTPPGMAVQAIVTANSGDYLGALPWLLGSLFLIPALLYLWAVILDRGITSSESAGAATSRRRRRAPVSEIASSAAARPVGGYTQVTRRPRLISNVALAITAKDLRYLWRDPQLKASLISVFIASFVVLAPTVLGSNYDGAAAAGPYYVLIAPLTSLIVVLSFGLNALGMDRQGLQTLFLFPVKPLDILWGKNLFVGGLAATLGLLLTLITAAITGGWQYVPLALAADFAAILTMLGCGNITSVLFPFRWRQMRMGETSTVSSENGCLRAIISMVSLGVTVILLIPVVLALMIPLLVDHRDWFVISLPLAVVYGAALHQIASRIIAPVMLRRAPDILAVTVRDA